MMGGAIFGGNHLMPVHNETPEQLIDLLRDVPHASSMEVVIDEQTRQFIPFGRLCRQAADAIEKLLEERMQWKAR